MTMRNFFSWLGGFIAFFILIIMFFSVAEYRGFPIFVDYGETALVMRGSGPTAYEDEASGATTGIGIALIALSVMLTVRFGMAISAGQIGGGVSAEGRIVFAAWFCGIATYGAGALLLDTAFGYVDGWHQTVRRIIELAFLIMIFLVYGAWRKSRLSQLRQTRLGNPADFGP
jgi:hypothetical protein